MLQMMGLLSECRYDAPKNDLILPRWVKVGPTDFCGQFELKAEE